MASDDSDSDGLSTVSNNILAYQNVMRVCAKGPNVNTNFSVTSLRDNNITNSTLNMPRARYAESAYDQRSMYYRRETSPMSFTSASGTHQRNFHNAYYNGNINYPRSTYTGRSGSPMSVRTVDSNCSLSAKAIALAFKTMKFNKYDKKMITKHFNLFIKGKVRKRIEKRRNRRYRRISGEDSGDQPSDTSSNSDDDGPIRSSRSVVFNDNASHRSTMSTRTDFMDFRRKEHESRKFKNWTDFRQNSFQEKVSVAPPNMNNNFSQNCFQNPPVPVVQANVNNNPSLRPNLSVLPQKDRSRIGYLLPSQRFKPNQSVALKSIPESCPQREISQIEKNRNALNLCSVQSKRTSQETDSEQEEIFSDRTVRPTHKRKFEDEDADTTISVNKRNKLNSSQDSISKSKITKSKQSSSQTNQNANDFEFVKPQLPLKQTKKHSKPNVKSTEPQKQVPKPQEAVETTISDLQPSDVNIIKSTEAKDKLISKPQPVERVISKSRQPLSPIIHDDLETNAEKDQAKTQLSVTNLSMRPSFIKRKLFTQNVEANNNVSSESLHPDSPQTNIYSQIQKEKNKARKLATQSCLSRDLGDDNNLLDLIHKIVPPDRMNVTTAINKSQMQTNKEKRTGADKWDISTIISATNNGDISDTYTDDEVFNTHESKQNPEKDNKQKSEKVKAPKDVEITDKKENQNKISKPGPNNKLQKSEKVKAPKDVEITDKKENQNKISKPGPNNKSQKSEKVKAPKDVEITDKKGNQNKISKPCPNNKSQKSEKAKAPKDVEITDKKGNPNKTSKPGPNNKSQKSEKVKASKDVEITDKKENLNKISKPGPNNKSQKSEKVKVLKDVEITDKKENQNKISNPGPNNKLIKSNGAKIVSKTQSKTKKAGAVNTVKSQTNTISPKQANSHISNHSKPTPPEQRSNFDKQKVVHRVKSFWDTDTDSELENEATLIKKHTQSNEKLAPDCTQRKVSNDEKTFKVNNYTPRIRTSKVLKCCAENKFDNTVNTTSNNSTLLYRTLRSRNIDLSSFINEDKSESWSKKNTVSKKNFQPTNMNSAKLENKENISNQSDLSFTLLSETPQASKRSARNRIIKTKITKTSEVTTRKSDVSFILQTEKTLKVIIGKNRELEELRRGVPQCSRMSRKSPLSKKVAPESLNSTRRSARLKKR